VTRRRLAAVPDTQRRGGLYVRVSAVMGRGGEDFLSPSIQIDTMRTAAARAGHQVVEVWEDIDVSGRSMNRPGLHAAVDAARAGRIDVLWVHDLSRLARNAAGGLTELAAIEKMGVDVLSATETVDRSTSSGRLTAGVLLLLAEHYSDLVGDRWRGVIEANARRGVWHGQPPRGYLRSASRTLIEDPVAGPVWREVFRRYAAGDGLRPLASYVTATLGTVVQAQTVSRTLHSPAYLGLVVLGERTFPGRHPALVDQPTWDRVQARLTANATVPSRTKQAVHSLAGLLRCGGCGGPLHKRRRASRGGDFLFCSTAAVAPDRCAGIGTPSLPSVERSVLEQLHERVAHLRDMSASQAALDLARQSRVEADARAVADELGRVEQQLGVLGRKLAEGVLSDTAYRAASNSLETSLSRLRARAQELVVVEVAPSPQDAASLAEALLELWQVDATDPEATAFQNRALRTHVRAVRVAPAVRPGSRRPRRITVDWVT